VYVAGFPASTTTVVDGSFQSTAGTVTGIASIPDNSGYSLIYDSITQLGMSGGSVLNEEGQLVAIHGRGAHDTLNSQKNGFNIGIVIEKIWTDSGLDGLKRLFLGAVDEKRRKRDYQGALQDYNQLIALNPQFGEAYYNRASLKSEELNDFHGALLDYNKCIELNPKGSAAYGSRGRLKATYLNDALGGVDDLDRAIKIHPKYGWYYYMRGWIKDYKLNDITGALLDYDQSILIDTEPRYYYQRGLVKKIK
jgi:tetratricopeptide (TPR) repeat protein